MNENKETWQLMLYVLMTKPVILVRKAEEILADLNDRSTTQFSLEEIIQQINVRVGRYGQELRLQTCDVTGKEYLLLINTISNSMTQTLTGGYSKEKREVYRKLVAEIITSDPLAGISTISVLNMAPDMPFHITKSNLEELVRKLVDEGWFCQKEGRLYFGVRSVAEMSSYLSSIYSDCVFQCCLCKATALTGVACNCEAVGHIRCVQRMSALVSGEFQCPSCKKPWVIHNYD